MTSNFVFWHLPLILPAVCALIARRSRLVRVVCILVILAWTWSLLTAGVNASMRNSRGKCDRARSQEYQDGWADGAMATQMTASLYRSPLITAVLCVAILALIPIQKTNRPNKKVEATGETPSPHL